LKQLNEKKIKYLLIGGYAVGFHGYPRATNDLDIFISRDIETANLMVSALKDFGFDTPQLNEDLFLKEKNIVRMGIAPMRIEILNTISGVTFEDCYREKIIEEIDGIKVCIINLEFLKINKKASGRHKDLDDIENLP
jgi:predicted nucleotidyltransferase